ncbi:dihydroorotate dehydrogenase electron transfer subunit [Peribacillus sp. SCS-37]|uniref:dihydroorotate dehydrogenase electron transfer subunit n=1 Tax=Paraperibacillus esterisolvens TaxID=3115296 RepID=UPI003905CD28
MIRNEMLKVVKQREIAGNIYELTLQGKMAGFMEKPGQFVHIKVSDGMTPLLRRPISISSIDRESSCFTMIYRSEGSGTVLLSRKKEQETVDVLGPLGNGFPDEAESGETAVLVGGGIGVPPLYELSRRLKSKGVRVIHVLGFATKDAVFYEDEFSRLGETFITTDDGTYGIKGLVTDVLKGLEDQTDIIFSCGPTPMLKALERQFGHKRLYLSLEERMGCGIGACFACVCHTADDPEGVSYKKVCSDGPVFRAGEVVL